MALRELHDIWNVRARRKDTLQAVMSTRWTHEQCRQATLTLKSVLYDAVGDVTDKKILECGSGVGRFTTDLANFGADVVGVDLSEEMIARARARSDESVSYIQGSVHSLPFSGECFDVSLAVTVFNHLPDIIFATALREMKRVTKLGGRIVCFDPLTDDPQPFYLTRVTTVHPLSAYMDVLGTPITKKIRCVDDIYTLMIWQNNPRI